MIEMAITEQMKEIARVKAEEMGKLYNSITRGDGNVAGFLGEAMVAKYTGAAMTNTYDYDLLYLDYIRIDVKTKRTDVVPKPFYECSVADFNTKQNCDWYVFTRVTNTLSKGWILGFMPKKDFYTHSRFCRKGDIDLANNFVFKADCYNISIEKLYPLPNIFPS